MIARHSARRRGTGVRSRTAAAAVTAALATVVSVAASGCSVASMERVGFGRIGMGVGSYTTTWTVGSCHRLDQLSETDPVYNSDTSPAVPCTSTHESETFAVVPITGAIAQQTKRPSPEWLQTALAGACSEQMLDTFLDALPMDALDDLSILQVVPSEPEWRAGVRKVRCDALVGPRTTQSVASISRTMGGVLGTSYGARFRSCRLGDVGLPCDGLHTTELIYPVVKFTNEELAKGEAYVITKVTQACTAEAAAYIGAPLSKRPDLKLFPELPGTAPDSGSEVGQCWVGSANGLSITGSVRRTGPGRVS